MKAKSGRFITFLPDSVIAQVSQEDQSLLEVALRSKVLIDHTCGGYGTCGTCVVHIKEGLEKLPPRNEIELEMAQDRGFQDFERLSCQTMPEAGLVVEVPFKA